MEPTTRPLDASGNEVLSKEAIPLLESPTSAADELSTTQMQLRITLERLRLEASEKEKLLELELEQLRVYEADRERKFRAEQAERDRELELEKIRMESHSDRHGSESWREKLEHFASSTTMHGAPKIIISESRIRRLVWLACFLGSWVMFIMQAGLVFQNYFTYPRTTNVEIVNEHPQFPDLTFCHRRGVSFYDAHEWMMRKHERMANNETLKSIMKDMNVMRSFVNDLTYYDPIFHSAEFQTFINRSAISKNDLFVSFYVKTIVDSRLFSFIGLQSKIREIPGGNFLRCFTVDLSDKRVKSIESYLLTGSGMVPDMSNETEYPWKAISSEEGAIVYIHQPGVKIDPIHDEQFYNLEPFHEYNFVVNVKQHVRRGPPQGQCSSSDPFVQGGQIPTDVPYRQQDCELACMARKFPEKFNGSVSMWYPPLEGMHCWLEEIGTLSNDGRRRESVERWCNYTVLDSGLMRRVITAKARPMIFGVNSSGCQCYPPCNETKYDVSVTSRSNLFRSDSSKFETRFEIFLEKYSRAGQERNNKSRFLEEYYWRNKTRALEDITSFSMKIGRNVHKTTESPLISRTQLISEIGGQLGVWIGISVITLVEVIELLIDLCGGCLRRGRKKELETSPGTTRQDGDTV